METCCYICPQKTKKWVETETFIIATHGIVKKSQKIPPKEIAKAEKIREEYFRNK